MHTRIQNNGSSKKTMERRYQRVDGAIHQCGSKLCRGEKTVEGRYACRPSFNWRMALDDDDDYDLSTKHQIRLFTPFKCPTLAQEAILFTRADESRGSKAFIRDYWCVCVYLSASVYQNS